MVRGSRYFLAVVAALGLALVLTGLFAWREASHRGSGASSGAIGAPFELVSDAGESFGDAALKGRPHIVFFGYTHCPDVCPTALAQISSVFRELGDAAPIGALFVTVDPQRDTPQVLKAYLESFDPRIVGLTGADAQIRAAARAFRVYYKKQKGEGEAYSMDHTGVVYLMDKNGRFVSALDLERPAKEVAAELRAYL